MELEIGDLLVFALRSAEPSDRDRLNLTFDSLLWRSKSRLTSDDDCDSFLWSGSDRSGIREVLIHILHAPDHLHPPHHIVTKILELWVFVSVSVENCPTLSVHFLLGESQTKLGHIGSGFNITRRSAVGSIRWKITPTVFHLSVQHFLSLDCSLTAVNVSVSISGLSHSLDGSLGHRQNSLAVSIQESSLITPTVIAILSDYFAH